MSPRLVDSTILLARRSALLLKISRNSPMQANSFHDIPTTSLFCRQAVMDFSIKPSDTYQNASGFSGLSSHGLGRVAPKVITPFVLTLFTSRKPPVERLISSPKSSLILALHLTPGDSQCCVTAVRVLNSRKHVGHRKRFAM